VRITGDSVNLRQGPGTDKPVVRKAARGEVLEVAEERDGWLRARDGAWLKADLAEPVTDAAAPASGGSAAPPVERMRRARQWGLLSLTGVYLKLIEVPPQSVVARRVADGLNALTGKPQDYTFFTIVIDVPPSAPYRFNFSPEHNRVQIVDRGGAKFGNFVRTAGEVEKLPPEVQALFEAQEVFPGNVVTGLLAFSGELRPERADRVFLFINGRMQELYEEH